MEQTIEQAVERYKVKGTQDTRDTPGVREAAVKAFCRLMAYGEERDPEVEEALESVLAFACLVRGGLWHLAGVAAAMRRVPTADGTLPREARISLLGKLNAKQNTTSIREEDMRVPFELADFELAPEVVVNFVARSAQFENDKESLAGQADVRAEFLMARIVAKRRRLIAGGAALTGVGEGARALLRLLDENTEAQPRALLDEWQSVPNPKERAEILTEIDERLNDALARQPELDRRAPPTTEAPHKRRRARRRRTKIREDAQQDDTAEYSMTGSMEEASKLAVDEREIINQFIALWNFACRPDTSREALQTFARIGVMLDEPGRGQLIETVKSLAEDTASAIEQELIEAAEREQRGFDVHIWTDAAVAINKAREPNCFATVAARNGSRWLLNQARLDYRPRRAAAVAKPRGIGGGRPRYT